MNHNFPCFDADTFAKLIKQFWAFAFVACPQLLSVTLVKFFQVSRLRKATRNIYMLHQCLLSQNTREIYVIDLKVGPVSVYLRQEMRRHFFHH